MEKNNSFKRCPNCGTSGNPNCITIPGGRAYCRKCKELFFTSDVPFIQRGTEYQWNHLQLGGTKPDIKKTKEVIISAVIYKQRRNKF